MEGVTMEGKEKYNADHVKSRLPNCCLYLRIKDTYVRITRSSLLSARQKKKSLKKKKR